MLACKSCNRGRVIYANVESKGVSIEEFEQVRLTKKEDRGGFAQKLFLISVEYNWSGHPIGALFSIVYMIAHT